eukprot:UN24618
MKNTRRFTSKQSLCVRSPYFSHEKENFLRPVDINQIFVSWCFCLKTKKVDDLSDKSQDEKVAEQITYRWYLFIFRSGSVDLSDKSSTKFFFPHPKVTHEPLSQWFERSSEFQVKVKYVLLWEKYCCAQRQ